MKPYLKLFSTALVAVTAVFADTTSINPSIDTWAAPGDAAATNISSTRLNVKNVGTKERAFMMFSLPALPAGAVIDSATLNLYMSQAPTKDGNPNPGSKLSRNYTVSRADAAWTAATSSILNTVSAVASIATASTGALDAVTLSWGGANFKTEVQNSYAGTSQLSLVVFDTAETGASGTAKYQSQFASSEDPANPPTLVIGYHVPGNPPPSCESGSLTISHNDYVGPNPIPWSVASSPNFFTIQFTITAGCKDLTSIKAQGGIASNLVIGAYSSDLGVVASKSVGQNNEVLTWRIDSLPAGTSAHLSIPVSGGYNTKSNAACGPKNLTGDWSANGYWLGNSIANQVYSNVGQLLVDFDCLN